MRLVYVAGKFRGPTPWAVEQNIRAAEEVALQVWLAGAAALCPHTNTRFFDKCGIDDQVFLDGTMEMLRRCDAVMLVSNWHDSSGAKAEVAEADRLKIPVFYATATPAGPVVSDVFKQWLTEPQRNKETA